MLPAVVLSPGTSGGSDSKHAVVIVGDQAVRLLEDGNKSTHKARYCLLSNTLRLKVGRLAAGLQKSGMLKQDEHTACWVLLSLSRGRKVGLKEKMSSLTSSSPQGSTS